MPAKGSGLLKYSDKKFFIVKAKAVGSIVGSKRLFLFRLCCDRCVIVAPLRETNTDVHATDVTNCHGRYA
jgi:hypothetical protein